MATSPIPFFFKLVAPVGAAEFGTNNQILLLNNFYTNKQPKFEEGITVLLTNKYLCLCQHNPQNTQQVPQPRIIELCYVDFDLKFQLIREAPSYEGNKTILGNPFAITFDKTGYQSFTMYGNSNDLLNWKDKLETMINRRGFHSLFKPVKKIGKGNFASVYLAESIQKNKMMAVKAFSKEASYSQNKGKQSLINEINLMRSLNQDNILKLYSVFESQNSIYMTLEHLEGDQLYTKIQSKHAFAAEETKQIMQGLLRGLAHMSEKRIMHRDIKPQNIMLRRSNQFQVVIVDFGLATWADESEYLFVRCGTPGYVAPQIINIMDMNTKGDPISDVFSIGLIFHILLQGRSIFPGRNYNQVLNQNRSCNINFDSFTYKMLPEATFDLMKRMLDKNPLTRIKASEALQHPYFVSSTLIPSQELAPCSPLVELKENNIINTISLQNKVSICHRLNKQEYTMPPELDKQNNPTQIRNQVTNNVSV